MSDSFPRRWIRFAADRPILAISLVAIVGTTLVLTGQSLDVAPIGWAGVGVIGVGLTAALYAGLAENYLTNLPHDRRRAGLCGKCGYDVRASTDRCPECGEPIVPPDWE